MNNNPSLLVFCQRLLRYSETFVLAQAENLSRFTPVYTGVSRVAGLDLPPDRCVTLSEKDGSLAGLWFKLTQRAPCFVEKLNKLDPVLIHAHFEDGGILALPIARKLGLPLVTTFHGYDATMRDEARMPNALVRRTCLRRRGELQREGALFIAVSEFIRQRLLRRGYPPARTIVHHIGVDTDRFCPQGERAGPPTALFVGRLVEKKGCAYLLGAMARIRKARPDVALVVIGDGPLRPALEASARALPNVRFLGSAGADAVRKHMKRATLLVAPSVTAASGDCEGLPIVICEAQAMGLPVIATRHAGIPEVIIDGATGLLVRERSSTELAERMLDLFEDDVLRESLGRAARADMVANFDLKRQSLKLEAVYEAVASGRDIASDPMGFVESPAKHRRAEAPLKV